MFTRRDVEDLVAHSAHPCISIYLATARRGPDTRRNPIELKNVLNEAQLQLSDAGIDRNDVGKMLDPLIEMQKDHAFHQQLDEGLAIFLAPGFSRHLLSPEPFELFVDLGDVFHIRPLLPLLARDEGFEVLALDRENVRLFTATRHAMRERQTDLPENWDKIRHMTDYEKQTGFHPSGPTPTTSGTPTPHYHSLGESPADIRKTQTEEFVNNLAKAVADMMSQNPERLLVLCGTPELAGMFRQRYAGSGLIEQHIDANPSGIEDQDLHCRAYALVEPKLRALRDAERERFDALHGDGDERADTRIEDIVPAAAQGRVESLFVARDAMQWGKFDSAAQRATPHSERQQGNIDLLNLAAREAFRNGGTVFTPTREDMPSNGALAAIYRY